MENKTETSGDLTAAVCAAIGALACTVERHSATIERLTTPQPTPFDQLLPAVLPLLVEKLGALLDKATRPRDLGEPVGPAERQVLDEFIQARDALLVDLDAKRKAARLADEIARTNTSAPKPTNGAAH